MKPELINNQYNLAKSIASQAHLNQKYGSYPYLIHLEAVQEVLERFGYSLHKSEEINSLRIAAWLHDALEDTVLIKDHIVYHFGEDVADLVWRVTDEVGRNRKEKKAATYPKIKARSLAVVLKLADRIANVEASLKIKKEKGTISLFNMYLREWEDFKKNLYDKDQDEKMWKHLESLLKV